MATLHVRNVPDRVYRALQRRAAGNGRSLNMEVVEALERLVEDDRRSAGLLERLDALRDEFVLADDAPSAEELIRAGRDERAREVERRARRLRR